MDDEIRQARFHQQRGSFLFPRFALMKADCQNQDTCSKTNLQYHLQNAPLFFPLKSNISGITASLCAEETIQVKILKKYSSDFVLRTSMPFFLFNCSSKAVYATYNIHISIIAQLYALSSFFIKCTYICTLNQQFLKCSFFKDTFVLCSPTVLMLRRFICQILCISMYMLL